MIRTLIGYIRAIPAFVARLQTEPVLIVGGVMIALTAYQSASTAGLGIEDTAILVAEAVLAWLVRQLVVPTAKIEGEANYVEAPLERPLAEIVE